MTDLAAETPRILAAKAMTRSAQGAGRFTFGFVGLLALTLKICEFGAQTNWAFLADFSNPGAAHWDQWTRVAILVLEALATAAVVSVAVTYVVVNSIVNNTTNNTSSTSSTVTNYNGQDLGSVITVIGAQLSEVRDRIAQFEHQLVRTQESERQRLNEFLRFAESETIKQKEAQLDADKQRFDDIAESLKKVVEVLNRP